MNPVVEGRYAEPVPKDIAARIGLTEGARVDIEASDDDRIICHALAPAVHARRVAGWHDA